ncbi:MAG: putative F420-dependent oxidoreductase [Candidatus Azotimanducaceae bacterium]|jgi:probable F420-dependent oxidoreductase
MKAETLLPLGKLDPGLKAPDDGLDLGKVASDAVTTESVGYQTLLMEETKDDPFQVLTMAALATQRVNIGTSVAIAFARSPFVIAQAAWTLQKISNGRFELGLGSQVRGHIMRRYGMDWHAAGPWMRDYVNAVRAIWHSWQTQSKLQFESDHYQLNLSVPLFTPEPIAHPIIPIHVAAVKPYMCKVATEVADGVRLHPVCSPRYIEEVVTAAVVGRQPGFEICLKPLIATARDDETLQQRKEIARQRLAFYCSTPAYSRAFHLYGLESLCADLASASKRQAWDQMAAMIDDDLLEEFVIVARYDELAKKIAQRYAGLIDRIEVSIPVANDADKASLNQIVKDINAIA